MTMLSNNLAKTARRSLFANARRHYAAESHPSQAGGPKQRTGPNPWPAAALVAVVGGGYFLSQRGGANKAQQHIQENKASPAGHKDTISTQGPLTK